MNSLKSSILLLASTIFSLSPCVVSEKVVVDLHSESANKLIEVTCLYNDDYNDFWVYGYPLTLTGDDDIYPNSRGFWTPGQAQRCEVHYYGGGHMPIADSVTLRLYLKGKPQILISSKYAPLEEEYTNEIGIISENDGKGWFEKTIDLKGQRALVFNFTLISMNDDVILLDKIIFDLGDDTTAPTEPPPTTTTKPIVDEIVKLDTDNDYLMLWEQDCHYIDDYSYFWAYGCPPVNPKQDDFANGYWSPCSASSCSLTFKANASVLWTEPKYIRVRSYVNGGARINITAQNNLDPQGNILGVISGTEDSWSEIDIPVTTSLSGVGYQIDIKLIPSEDSTILLEKVELHLLPKKDGIDGSTTPPPDSASGISSLGLFFTTCIILLTKSPMFAFH